MNKELSKKQRYLLKKHGSPQEFAEKCRAAVPGMISVMEAKKAIMDYQQEWDKAGETDANH